jgi:hypothetical protein
VTRTSILLALSIALGVPASSAGAPASTIGERGLDDLFSSRGGTIHQYSSRAPTAGLADSWQVPPHGTVVLVDHRGAGVVRRWWMTLVQYKESPDLFRKTILRCYWDDETDPSVETPLSDFFGLSFGEWHDYVSIPLSATSGGFNCYWPMPFHSRARITLENRSDTALTGLFFNIEVESTASVPKDALYFHAQFRRTAPTQRGKPVVVLEATGAGQYVGTVLSAQALRGIGLRFLEGNERIYVDGEDQPSVSGTGTEDYFGAGLYFVTGPFSAPSHGVTVLDREQNRVGAYRWHIPDPIPFRKSLRFELQHGPADNVTSDYATLAVWYQSHPHARFPALPAELGSIGKIEPFTIAGLIEAEGLAGNAYATKGQVSLQSMEEFEGEWSGDAQLLWRATGPGDHLTLFLQAPETREYHLEAYLTRSADYGDVKILPQGRELATVRGYHEGIATTTGAISLGKVALQSGENALLLEIAGKDSRSAGYAVGIDGFRLTP